MMIDNNRPATSSTASTAPEAIPPPPAPAPDWIAERA